MKKTSCPPLLHPFSPSATGRFSPEIVSLLLVSTLLACIVMPGIAQGKQREFVDLSLQELGNVEIFSVSKKYEPLTQAPAAAYVITSQDIQRSGATTLQEALRLAPNLEVARSNARNYGISARGFNSIFANKLLVMMDGRVLYSPLYSGVFWDAQDYILEDIDRIEVISGAGGTLWGTNAVNGVINILTKSASQTQGGLVSAGTGNKFSYGSARYGGKLDNGGHYRIYSKVSEHEDLEGANGLNLDDGWQRNQAGFRFDWDTDPTNSTSIQGNFYDGTLNQFGTNDIYIAGGNFRGLYKTVLDNGSDISIRSWLDYTHRDQPNAFRENLTTWDIELRHNIKLAQRHALTYGGGYRIASENIESDDNFAFWPDDMTMHWVNLFAQDDIELTKKLRLIVGLRLEHNFYTNLEYLPNVRLAWSPSQEQMLWTSISRSVRAPSRIDRDFFAPANPPFLVAGGPNFDSEIAHTFEVGYRTSALRNATVSITAFYSEYDRLRSAQQATPLSPFTLQNNAEGRSHGVEIWGDWKPLDKLKLTAGVVFQQVALDYPPGLLAGSAFDANDPSKYGMLKVSYDIRPNHLLDAVMRYSGRLSNPDVPSYTSMDVRYGWKINPDVELSVIGQNLLDDEHPEFSSVINRAEFERGVFARLQWYFR